MKEYGSNKTSLLQEAKGRVKQEGKRMSVDRKRPSQATTSKAVVKKTPSMPLSKSTKQLILLVVAVLVVGFILYHIPYGKIGRAISEKTHHLGKSVHQQVVSSKNNKDNDTATAESSKNAGNADTATEQKKSDKAAADTKPVVQKPTLDFYKVLPKRKVVVTWS